MYIGHRAEPSFRFPQKLAKDTKGKKITSYAKQLALTMFSYASQRTGKVNKTQRELAKLSGMTLDTVSRKLKELDCAGLLYIQRCMKRNGAFSSNSYLPLRATVAARRPILDAVPEDTAQLTCLFGRVYADIQNNEDRPKITGVLTREEKRYTTPIFWNINMPGQKAGGASSAGPCKTMFRPAIFARESRSGERGDPPQRGESGEVTFSVSRPSRPALFGSPLSLPLRAGPPREKQEAGRRGALGNRYGRPSLSALMRGEMEASSS